MIIHCWKNYNDQVNNEKIKIKIDSDRACYILGEFGKAMPGLQGCDLFYRGYLGIGAGILINNEVLRGSNDIAGALGWMALDRPFNSKIYFLRGF
jgi:glucokinase